VTAQAASSAGGHPSFNPQHALQTAMAQHQAGNLVVAESLYKQVLQSAPNQPDALHLLGLIAKG